MSKLSDKVQADSLIKTLNQMGYTSKKHNKYTKLFLTYLDDIQEAKILEIGAAFGIATIPALEKGATVTAVDLDEKHLEILQNSTPAPLKERLNIVMGHFPNTLDFPDSCFDAVLASQVFHYLKGEEIEAGLQKIRKWLKPGGKLFVTMGTPYVKTIQRFIPIFEERKRQGDDWPGLFSLKEYCDDIECVKDNPEIINFADKDILSHALLNAGFVIEKIEEFSRQDFSEELKFSGKECVGSIAIKKN
jgi:SAM-dependent methyltransferase